MAQIEDDVIAASKKLGWRLKARHCHCLARDIFFVLVGLRPLVMIDYLPYSSDFCQLLTALLNTVCKAYSGWRIMYIDESIFYFLHQANLEEYMEKTLCDGSWLEFIVLDDGPVRMATKLEAQAVKNTLREIQIRIFQSLRRESLETAAIDFSHDLSDLDISIHTCNGWLLGYPVIYAFSKDKASQASRCLSSVNLCLYKLHMINPGKIRAWRPHGQVEEIFSFTIPEAAIGHWSPDKFMLHITRQASRCDMDPGDLRLETVSKLLQSIAF